VELWTAAFTGVAFSLAFPSVTLLGATVRYIGERSVPEYEPQGTRAGPPLRAVTPVCASGDARLFGRLWFSSRVRIVLRFHAPQ